MAASATTSARPLPTAPGSASANSSSSSSPSSSLALVPAARSSVERAPSRNEIFDALCFQLAKPPWISGVGKRCRSRFDFKTKPFRVFSSSVLNSDRAARKSDSEMQAVSELEVPSGSKREFKLSEETSKRLALLYLKLEYAINSDSFSETTSVLRELIELFSRERVSVNAEKFSLLLFTFGKLFREDDPLEASTLLHQFFALGFDTLRAQKNFRFLKSLNIACRRLLFPIQGGKEVDLDALKFQKFVLSLLNSRVDPFQTIVNKFDNRYLKGYCKRLLNQHKTRECVEFLEFLHDHRIPVEEIYNSNELFSLCLKQNDKQLAKRYIRLLPQHLPYFESMVKDYARRNRLSDASDLISIMTMDFNASDVERGQIDEEDLAGNRVKDKGRKNGKWGKPDVKPDSHIYRLFIDLCQKEKNNEILFQFFERMLEDGFKPNVYIYNSLMNVNSAKTELLWDIYSHMIESHVSPDEVTFNILLKSCAMSSNTQAGIQLYKKLLELRDKGQITIDVITYTSAIQVFARAKMWEEALNVKTEMEKDGVHPNVITYTALVGACTKAGMVDKAFDVFEEMVSREVFPNTNTYNVLIDACANAGQVKRAFDLVDEMKRGGRKAQIEGLVGISVFGQEAKNEPFEEMDEIERKVGLRMENSNTGGDLEPKPAHKMYEVTNSSAKDFPLRGRGTIQEVDTTNSYSFPDRVTYHSLMKACSSNPQKVKEVMNEMKMMNIKSNLLTWTILIDSYASAQDMNGALSTLEDMKKEGVFPDVVLYTSIIKACVKSDNIAQAFYFFEEMKSLGIKPNLITYNTLLRKNKNFGSLFWIQKAIELYHEMREAGYAPNDYLLKSLLEEWAEGAIENSEQIALGRKQIQKRHSLVRDMDNEYGKVHPTMEVSSNRAVEKESNETESFDLNKNLISRVSFHALERPTSDLFTVDVQNLSQAEARTTVLSVLRILKEKFQQSNVENDLVIILGDETNTELKNILSIRESLVHMLKDELGFMVQIRNYDSDPSSSSSESDEDSHFSEEDSLELETWMNRNHGSYENGFHDSESSHKNELVHGDHLPNRIVNESDGLNTIVSQDREDSIRIELGDIKVENIGKSSSNLGPKRLFGNDHIAKRPSISGKLLIPQNSLNKWLNKRRESQS